MEGVDLLIHGRRLSNKEGGGGSGWPFHIIIEIITIIIES